MTASTAHPSRKISLQWILVLSFLRQLFGTVGLVGFSSFRNGKKSRRRASNSAAESQLSAFNQELQGRIQVRTAALSEATDNLQQAQDQVEQSEKLSALGELVAGVAHEINNPIGCITNNVQFIEEYGEQLLEHITLYQKLLKPTADSISASALSEIKEHGEDIDLDYIATDFPALMQSMATSGERITAISQSLRTANAVDAIAGSKTAERKSPTITIKTVLAGSNNIGSKITDNAGGVPEAIKSADFRKTVHDKICGKRHWTRPLHCTQDHH